MLCQLKEYCIRVAMSREGEKQEAEKEKSTMKFHVIANACISIILSLFLGAQNANYYNKATPAGKLESKYTPLGSSPVSYVEYGADNETYGKYEVWYPAELEQTQTVYPLVIMANGTGVKASQYKEVFQHLASWGFIVAGNEDENSRTGASSAATLDFLLRLNKESDSIFYGKVDAEHIGIAGHSQGGVGAINAVTEQPNGNQYKAIYAISATSSYHADELNKNGEGWSIDASKIKVPIMMVAGTGAFDAGNVDEYQSVLAEGEAQGICPLWWLNECYDTISESVPKVTARMAGKDHGDMLRASDAYMTAWFCYWLKGDADAGRVFSGPNAELLTNSNYQDQRSNF